MRELIIPGVSVQVVKEVLPKQLTPSGVLGLIGFTEDAKDKVERASSYARFLEVFGRASAHSLPEARQALDNGASELVISPLTPLAELTATVEIPGSKKARLQAEAKILDEEADKAEKEGKEIAKRASASPAPVNAGELNRQASELSTTATNKRSQAEQKRTAAGAASNQGDDQEPKKLIIEARAPGPWANTLELTIEYRDNLDKSVSFDITIAKLGTAVKESFRGVRKDDVADRLKSSTLVRVRDESSKNWPAAGSHKLTGGRDASREAYEAALRRLSSESDVDMVLAAVQDFSDLVQLTKIYGDVITHCNLMSADCKGRIGFGQVPPAGDTESYVRLASNLVSDRFVLVAPNGVAGAVAGLVGSLPYYHSPTFKQVQGASDLASMSIEAQSALLKGNVVPVALERGRGVIVLKGITTDGDQISVRRVADRATRMMNMIGQLFIGLLNNADGRTALKQKLASELLQMEKDGALVPSTDGKDPAFKVDVYSSQTDFAKGWVRVNMAVRPARAIDYIYATITVQV